ncbi:MAG: hypothetical protein IKD36_01075 [Clostridia bacterium]|nr:hypothetical protein [Clostridia bacterium]
MNKIELKKRLRDSMNIESFKLNKTLHINLKQDIVSVLKDYYDVDEKSLKVVFKILKNGDIVFDLSCLIRDKNCLS